MPAAKKKVLKPAPKPAPKAEAPKAVAQAEDGKQKPRDVREFLDLAKTRFKMAADAEAPWRKLALEDLKFSIGDQWPEEILADRTRRQKPCMVFNRVGQTVKQVTNNQRQQRPAIQVNPAGSGSSKEVAEILQGCVRHIEVQSDAEVAYDIAFDYMARSGKAFFRVITDYLDEDGNSLDQEIYIEGIDNPFSVYSDPRAKKDKGLRKETRRFLFVIEDMAHEEYRAQYGDSEAANMQDMSSIGDNSPDWANKDTIRVAEYFYLETVKVHGSARVAFVDQLHWAKINAVEILEERELKEKFIPVVEVVGDDLVIDGKRHTAGLVRDTKDPQRNYNYHVSKAVEVVALAPSVPFTGPKGAFTDPRWETANTGDWATLEWDPRNIAGDPITGADIQRLSGEPPIQAIAGIIKQADNDIKATTGIYDASLGERGPDESGKAILQRKQQGDNATFNYTDNLARAIRFTGRVLLDKIRVYYDVPRVQRIINPDNSVDHVGIYNSETSPDFDPASHPDFQDIKRIFDIGAGRYDVTVSVGPSYQTKRQEAAAMQLELMKNVPIVQQAAPDIVIANMDIPGADVIAKRVKKALPPQLQDNDEGSPEGKAAALEAKLTALSQQHELLAQELQKATRIIETKQVEQAGKIVIVKLQEATKMSVAQMTASKDANENFAQREFDAYELLHNASHEIALQKDQQSAAADQSAQGHAQDLEAQDQGAAHAQDAAAQQAALNPPQEQPNE